MGLIQTRETDLYDEVWGGLDHYGDQAPGEQWAEAFVAMISALKGGRILEGESVLDAGSGSGKGALALLARGFDVSMCDLTAEGLVDEARSLPFVEACLWDDLRRKIYQKTGNPSCSFDWVYCCDVLEHIPTEFTMLTIARLLAIARRGVFLSITFVPDNFGALLGRPLHQTVQSYTWWKERLGELGEVVEARDCLQSGLFLVRPR